MQLIVPPYPQTPASLLSDCDVPYIPESLNVTGLANLLTDALADLQGCNAKMGLLRKVEADRVEHYRKLSESAQQ